MNRFHFFILVGYPSIAMAADREFMAFTGFRARLGVGGEIMVPSASTQSAPKSPDRSGRHVEVVSDSPDHVTAPDAAAVSEPSLVLMLENLGKMMTVAESWQRRMAADEQADLFSVFAEAVDQLRLSLTMAFTEASDEKLVTVPKALGRTVHNLVNEFNALKDRLNVILAPAPKRLKRNSSGPESPVVPELMVDTADGIAVPDPSNDAYDTLLDNTLTAADNGTFQDSQDAW